MAQTHAAPHAPPDHDGHGVQSIGVRPAQVQPAQVQPSAQTRPAERIVEPAAPITLERALSLAMSANAELSAAGYEAEAVNATIRQARALPNPEVAVLMEDTRRDTRSTTFQINQPIELGGKRAARITAASRSYDAAVADLGATRAGIRALVITAFFDVLNAQERMRLAEESLTLAQRGTYVASRRVAAGKVSPVEETRARVAEANTRLELSQARGEISNARKRLAATWGNVAPRFTQAEGALEQLPPLPDWHALEARLGQSPALTRARFEVDRRQALAQLENSRRTPDVTVSMGVKRDQEIGRNQAIVGLSIPFPLFNRNRGNMLEALRRTDKARDELTATELRLDGELAQAFERLRNAREEVDTLQRDILPGAQSAYEAATKGFEFGKFAFLDVLDAQRTLLQARSQYLRSLSEAHRAAAEIDRILGEQRPVIPMPAITLQETPT